MEKITYYKEEILKTAEEKNKVNNKVLGTLTGASLFPSSVLGNALADNTIKSTIAKREAKELKNSLQKAIKSQRQVVKETNGVLKKLKDENLSIKKSLANLSFNDSEVRKLEEMSGDLTNRTRTTLQLKGDLKDAFKRLANHYRENKANILSGKEVVKKSLKNTKDAIKANPVSAGIGIGLGALIGLAYGHAKDKGVSY